MYNNDDVPFHKISSLKYTWYLITLTFFKLTFLSNHLSMILWSLLQFIVWKETFFFTKFLTKSWQEKPFSRPQNCLVEHISILMNSLMQIFSIINFSFYHIHTDLHTQYWLVSELLSTLAFTIMVHPTSLGKICKAVCLPNR